MSSCYTYVLNIAFFRARVQDAFCSIAFALLVCISCIQTAPVLSGLSKACDGAG